MSEKSHSSRLAAYKHAGQGTTELRRKRAELSVTLRRAARDEQLQKRRALSPGSGDDEPQSVGEKENLPTPSEIVQGMKSSDLSVVLTSTKAARRMLSREQNPPIAVMLQAGVIAPLVQSLYRDEWYGHLKLSDLQFEAAWALTNIASGSHEHTMAVVDGGAVPQLVSLLGRGGTVGEQCAWALGNIAGDGAQSRDLVLAHGTLPALLPSLAAEGSLLNTAVWTYSNLCRNKNPLVNFELVAPALPYISDLLEKDHQDVLADACWALSYLTDGPNDRIEEVQMTPKLLPRLVHLLDHKSPSVKTPALRAIGNMVTGSDEQTDRCLDVGSLDYLIRLLNCGKASLIKEASWAISNVLAGTQEQIQRVIDAGVLPQLVRVIAHEDNKSQKEAAWAITNLCLGGTGPQLDTLFSSGFLEPYCALLGHNEPRACVVVLDGITHLLQAAEKYGQVEALCLRLEEIGALDHIESLQNHENEMVYKKSLHIIDKYFSESEDASAEPEKTDQEYTFGSNQPANNMRF